MRTRVFEDLAVLVNGANGSRATVYIRSVAAYKHTTLVCAMLANNTYNLRVALISDASWLVEAATEASTLR